jgi:ribosome-binding factor A
VSVSRAGRVADEVRRVLARLIHEELRDPRVGFVTLTEVRVSPDLRHALAFFTVLDAARREETLAGLDRAAPFLRRSLAREARLRFTPDLRFVFDEAAAGAARIEAIFDRDRRERDGPPRDDE